MATYARLAYDNKVQTVALFEGLNNDELVSLLKTVFDIDGTIVGLLGEVRQNVIVVFYVLIIFNLIDIFYC